MVLCKKPYKLNEFTAWWTMFPPLPHDPGYYMRVAYDNMLTDEDWQQKIKLANRPDSVSKLQSLDFLQNRRALSWWQDVNKNQTHDIIVLVRNRMDQALSYLLASQFGWSKKQESQRELKNFTVQPYQIAFFDRHLTSFFEYFPAKAEICTFETLPGNLFEKYVDSSSDQKSFLKYKYIDNFEWCVEQIQLVIDYHSTQWQEKVGTIVP
jgi:hypothetical protein